MTLVPLTFLVIIIFCHKPDLPTRLLFFDISVRLRLQDSYQKDKMCIVFRSKVLIIFIVKFNNSISFTKSVQYVITIQLVLLKVLNMKLLL